MDLTLTTPAILFPAISLLLLAYTNRFLAIATLIRNLYRQYKEERDPLILPQIHSLKRRVKLIRDMQFLGISSMLLSVISMFLIYLNLTISAAVIFGISLIFLILSLAFSIGEIRVSIRALNIQLSDIEDDIQHSRKKK